MTNPDATAPLQGLVVADFSRVLAGPLASMVLGDLGAEVIKVERPAVGDDTRGWGPPWRGQDSTYFLSVNRNKRSMILDLSDPDDLDLAVRLSDRADVLIHNFRPGTAEALGLGYAALSASNPGLVYASISGFGTDRAAAGLGGYDFLVQAMSGLMSITGEPDGPENKVGVALVDVMCGLYTVIGVQAALAERERSGRGQEVHVSLMGAALAALVNQASAYLGADVIPGRMGNRHPSIVPYETVAAADRPVAVAVGSDRLFDRLVQAVGLPELAADPRFGSNADRVAHREGLIGALQDRLGTKPAAHWVALLRQEGIPAGLVNDVAEAFAEADRLGLDPVIDARAAEGPSTATVRSPLGLSRTPTVDPTAPPRLGQHDSELRRWLQGDPDDG